MEYKEIRKYFHARYNSTALRLGNELVGIIEGMLPYSGGGWISVKDRLPERQTTVIVHGGVAYWNGKQWRTLTGEVYPGRVIEWKVTHWQEIPLPPEEE